AADMLGADAARVRPSCASHPCQACRLPGGGQRIQRNLTMKKLLTTVAMLTALCAPAAAAFNDQDRAIAAFMVYATYCDENDIPPRVRQYVDQYTQGRPEQVLEAKLDIVLKHRILSQNDFAHIALWCVTVRRQVFNTPQSVVTGEQLLEHLKRRDEHLKR